MADDVYKCVKCAGEMVRGFIADYSERSYFLAKWAEGEPVNPTFLGITGTNVEMLDRPTKDVRALRCSRCGFLELYAV
ncbi:MAG: hypothetical protein UZ17_ACD001001238 [Acidobacteria bacterium OLB17]|nr:MAG: hypothetical protein UZ17_ACD001001238 [Acidobacteria bacterium OLB17]MCZ2391822.1 hypothetical protein [Acidobacteriota bacterium]